MAGSITIFASSKFGIRLKWTGPSILNNHELDSCAAFTFKAWFRESSTQHTCELGRENEVNSFLLKVFCFEVGSPFSIPAITIPQLRPNASQTSSLCHKQISTYARASGCVLGL